MDKFLSQFKGLLSPIMLASMDGMFYRVADQWVPGYAGGHWPVAEFEGMFYREIPVDPDPRDGKVTIANQMSGTTRNMSPQAASFCISFLVGCWTMERWWDSFSDSGQEKWLEWKDQMLDAARKFSEDDRNAFGAIID